MRPQAGVDRLKPVPPMHANDLPLVAQAVSPAYRIFSRLLTVAAPIRAPSVGEWVLSPSHALYRVGSGRNVAALARPVSMEEFAARLVDALVGVGPEVIALRLQQIRRQPRAAIAVKERQRRHRKSTRLNSSH